MAYDVYDPAQRSYRVDFACAYILRNSANGFGTTRRFDTCFEMGDGDIVAARVYRRALKNPRLMELLPRYLNLNLCRANYEKHFGKG